jgi:hypothetical protein
MEKVTVHSKSREIAEAAQREAPGAWTHEGGWRALGSRPCSCGECGENETVAKACEIPVAAHIAHFHPARALALLDVIKAQSAALDSYGDYFDSMPCSEDEEIDAALEAVSNAEERLNALDEADHE